jgi:hypothetical protein
MIPSGPVRSVPVMCAWPLSVTALLGMGEGACCADVSAAPGTSAPCSAGGECVLFSDLFDRLSQHCAGKPQSSALHKELFRMAAQPGRTDPRPPPCVALVIDALLKQWYALRVSLCTCDTPAIHTGGRSRPTKSPSRSTASVTRHTACLLSLHCDLFCFSRSEPAAPAPVPVLAVAAAKALKVHHLSFVIALLSFQLAESSRTR